MTDTAQALAEALRDAMSALDYVRFHYGELYGVGFDRVRDVGDDALAAYDEKRVAYDAAPAPVDTAARLAAAGLTIKKLDWEAVKPSDDNDHATYQAWMSWWNGSSNSLKLVSSGATTPEAAQAGFEADVLAALTEDRHD